MGELQCPLFTFTIQFIYECFPTSTSLHKIPHNRPTEKSLCTINELSKKQRNLLIDELMIIDT